MPVTKSAKRALRKALRRRERNLYHIKNMKNAIREFKKNPTIENLRKAISVVDHIAGKGVITKNEASRRKSRLMRLFHKLQRGG